MGQLGAGAFDAGRTRWARAPARDRLRVAIVPNQAAFGPTRRLARIGAAADVWRGGPAHLRLLAGVTARKLPAAAVVRFAALQPGLAALERVAFAFVVRALGPAAAATAVEESATAVIDRAALNC